MEKLDELYDSKCASFTVNISNKAPPLEKCDCVFHIEWQTACHYFTKLEMNQLSLPDYMFDIEERVRKYFCHAYLDHRQTYGELVLSTQISDLSIFMDYMMSKLFFNFECFLKN